MAILGKFSIHYSAYLLGNGQFTGTAAAAWDEADATLEKQLHFHKEFATEAEAITNAERQTQVRFAAGSL